MLDQGSAGLERSGRAESGLRQHQSSDRHPGYKGSTRTLAKGRVFRSDLVRPVDGWSLGQTWSALLTDGL